VARIEIAELLYDERAEAKMWAHGVDALQLAEIALTQQYVIIRNRGNRAALHIVYGRDFQGRCIAVLIIPASHPGVWRAITAWYCKPSESAILNRRS
jgi:hypothetical protein